MSGTVDKPKKAMQSGKQVETLPKIPPGTPAAGAGQTQGQQAAASGSSQDAGPVVMRKGVLVNVKLYIEGMDPPPDDFAKRAVTMVTEMLGTARSATYPDWKYQIRKIEAQDDTEDD